MKCLWVKGLWVKSVGDKSVGEKQMGVDGMLAFVPPFSGLFPSCVVFAPSQIVFFVFFAYGLTTSFYQKTCFKSQNVSL